MMTKEDFEKTREYEGRVDYFLFDTRCEGYGGSGKRFDWSILTEYKGETPFLLSGGIRPENAEAIRNFRHPRFAGIDLNSGFEIEPGRYVTLTDDDFEKAKAEKDRTIHILHFADLQDIRPIYFDKTYHTIPESGGDKAYELLRRCMLEEHAVAIAKGVIGQSEHLMA